MYRFMKHTPTGTIHSYEAAWLRAEDHGFVECDKNGNALAAPIEGEVVVVVGIVPAKKPKPVKKVAPPTPTEESQAIDDAIEAASLALSADASHIK